MSAETFTTHYHEVECPYCGHKNDLGEQISMRGESLDSYLCGDCGKDFDVRVHISWSVTAIARRPK